MKNKFKTCLTAIISTGFGLLILFFITKYHAPFTSSSIEKIVKSGDIIFQISQSNQSKAIQLATRSPYSHVGIIYKDKQQYLVYEAVQPVKLTPLADWVHRGERAHFVIKRLKNDDQVLTSKTLQKMKQVGERYMGKDYDFYFEWSDDKVYCSELIWKIYKEATGIELGKLEKLGDFNLSDDVVKLKLQERYGQQLPFNELIISPAAIFNLENLVLILSN